MTSASYASISRRLLAMLLDALILVIPVAIASQLVPVLGGILIAFLYAPVLESSEARATIGKHLMGIQVADIAGERISFRAACIRYFLKIVSSVLLFIGHALALFTQRRQALHDLAAETIVVYGRLELSLFDAWLAQFKAIVGSRDSGVSKIDTLGELERLAALRDKGALTDAEFEAAKKRLLGL
ncbi:MAG: RDD family protein [Oligoflexia bacterium]|nr:RDD family protein [Oligoflexia bacterium]